MTAQLGPTTTIRAVPSWAASVLAGMGAGAVAAVACVASEMALRSQLPPRVPTLWSAFVAGILGGLLYGWLARVVRRPAAALWAIALVVATIDSLLIAMLPAASGRGPSIGIPIVGLVAPLRQLLALVGIGHLGTRHFPASSLLAFTATHYITAVSVALLVPRWAIAESAVTRSGAKPSVGKRLLRER
jgi:hypothetical protein